VYQPAFNLTDVLPFNLTDNIQEASTVFLDENAVLFDDPEHSMVEERFMLLRMSS